MSFNKLFDKIEKIHKKDSAKTEFEFLCYLTEEIGEVSRCISENNNLKKYKQTESVLSECSDVLNSLIGLYCKLGGDKKQFIENALAKAEKWEKRVNSNGNERISRKGGC